LCGVISLEGLLDSFLQLKQSGEFLSSRLLRVGSVGLPALQRAYSRPRCAGYVVVGKPEALPERLKSLPG
jgi:hypothetical protein